MDSSDLDGFIMSNLVRKGKKMARTGKRRDAGSSVHSRVSSGVRDLLGKGSMSFVQRDYDSAITFLEEAIRLAPGLADPFVTLGAVYEEIGDTKRGLEALLVAVHLTPGDHSLWKRVALMSESIGNSDQAIYCLKRCAKSTAASEEERESYLRDLGHVFMQTGRFLEASQVWRKLFALKPGDGEIGSLFAKSLYSVNEKPEAMRVLESLVTGSSSTPDANAINMLAEVYLDIREWGRCFTLLTAVLDMEHLHDPERCPVDLVAKLAIAAAPSHARHARVCEQAAACISACSPETHADLYIAVADGFLANGLTQLALSLLEPALEKPVPEMHANCMQVRVGKCQYALGNFEAAARLLAHCDRDDPESVVMLADSWRQTGREAEAGQLLLSSLNYEDLLACRTLPSALSTTQRRKMLEQLTTLLANVSDSAIANRVAEIFLPLLSDCELDAQRVARHTGPAWKVRKELDLEGVEDIVGAGPFVELVKTGARVCASVDRCRETIELLEAILHNKRKKWLQRTDAGVSLIDQLETLSFSLSLEAGIYKTAIKYLRLQVGAALEEPIDEAKLALALSRMTNLMFGSPREQREMLDQRSWLVRVACRHPAVFALCLFCGHMCVFSGNWKFASQEFQRAHRLRPTYPWPLLCLGSSLLSLAQSRTTGDKQFTVLKAFSVLAEYARVRGVDGIEGDDGDAAGAIPGCRGRHQSNLVEIHFNLGRAFHQLSLFTQADREYRRVLELVGGLTGNESSLGRLAAYNLGLIRQKSNLRSSHILLPNIVAR